MDKKLPMCAAVAVVLLYFFYPSYQLGKNFLGLPSEFYLIAPFLVAGIVWWLMQRQTFLDDVKDKLMGGETSYDIEDPMIILDRFENTKDRILLPFSDYTIKGFNKMDYEWCFTLMHEGQKHYLFLDGRKAAKKLNPSFISAYDLREQGYEDIIDFKRNRKARQIIDLVKAGVGTSGSRGFSNPEEIGKMLGDGKV